MDGRRRRFSMARGGEVILDAAQVAGLDLPFSCRAGVCSTCRAKLVSGSAEMEHNVALEDWEVEAGYILCCQARPDECRARDQLRRMTATPDMSYQAILYGSAEASRDSR